MTNPLRFLAFAIALCLAGSAQAGLIQLQNATATVSQTGFTPNQTIDGSLVANNGWAIFPSVTAQTIVWETALDQGTGNDQITFQMFQNQGSNHTILRYRLSYTTDNRSQFANGLASGGDVTANWTVINLDAFSGTGAGLVGAPTLTELTDFSILASGNNPVTSTYTSVFTTSVTGITGFRLEVLEDPTSTSGPGRQANQNLVLTEMRVDVQNLGPSAVPEPGTFTLLSLGLAGLAGLFRRGF